MDDDKTKQPVNEVVEDEKNPVEPEAPVEPDLEAEEPAAPAEPETPKEPVEPEEPKGEGEPEAPPSPRESKRIKQLTEKLAKAHGSNLSPGGNQPEPFQEREEGYQLDEANKIAQDYGASQFEKGLAESKALEFKLNLRIDAPKVEQKYDVLNKDSEQYDPGRTAFINELYLRTVGYDPQNGHVRDASIGYEEFVDGIMDAVDKQASAAAADSAVNIAKQASRQGIRPTGESKKAYSGDDPKQMTDAQLEARISAALPKK